MLSPYIEELKSIIQILHDVLHSHDHGAMIRNKWTSKLRVDMPLLHHPFRIAKCSINPTRDSSGPMLFVCPCIIIT